MEKDGFYPKIVFNFKFWYNKSKIIGGANVEKYVTQESSGGNVQIADDVLAKIAMVAASHVDGVYAPGNDLMSGVADVAGKFGVRTPARGAKVSVGENEAILDLSISVEYGKNIVGICNEIQKKVKESVENMTGLNVIEINVHVVGISTPNTELEKRA